MLHRVVHFNLPIGKGIKHLLKEKAIQYHVFENFRSLIIRTSVLSEIPKDVKERFEKPFRCLQVVIIKSSEVLVLKAFLSIFQ